MGNPYALDAFAPAAGGEMMELKPCPWCGLIPTIRQRGSFRWFACPEVSTCRGTNIWTLWPEEQSDEQAIEWWNRRATDENAAYERAAMVCEESPDRFEGNASALTAKHCAAAIRALKK